MNFAEWVEATRWRRPAHAIHCSHYALMYSYAGWVAGGVL